MYLLLLAFVFSISSLLVGQTDARFTAKLVVENVEITNDSLVSSEHLEQLQQEITKQEYRENAQDEIAEGARYELQKQGYFKADVTMSDLQVLSETPGQRTVAVTLRINEGRRYRLQRINFVHNRVFASSRLRQAFAIKDQDVFDTEKIRLGLEELRKLYASVGYINFVPVPNTEPNEQAGTVALLVDIDEGKQFKIESLTLKGKWPQTDEERLTGIFQLYAGGLNVSELLDELKAAIQAMFPGLASASDIVEVRQNVKKGTVDVSVMRPATR
ncbi:MAG: POTRA domain-containing protein [Candidatus Korobacteraceae bacterium]|jgi:outer membrane protein insertion porin family